MKKHSILFISLLLAGFSFMNTSCEMEKELRGKTEIPGSSTMTGNLGALQLNLNPQKEAPVSSKSEITDLLPDDFSVSVYNENGTLVHYFESFVDMLAQGSVLMLEKGTYTVKAALGELKEAEFDNPYYEGTGSITINPKEVSTVTMDCPLANKKISITLSESFLEKFRNDYTLILTNGQGVLTQKYLDSRTAYFKDNNLLNFIIHATTLKGESYTYSINLYDNELLVGHNNILVNLDILPDPEKPPVDPDPNPEPEEPDPEEPDPDEEGIISPIIKVDVSLIEREYVIEIPSDFINPDEGGNSGEEGQKNPPTITGNGLSAPITMTVAEAQKGATVKLDINTPNGLKNLYVQISSSSSGFMEILSEMTLNKQFDLMNLTSTQDEYLSEVGLSKPQDAYSNIFDISSFVPMIAIYKSGTYNFKLTVVDQLGQSVTKTLTIKLTD